MDFIHTVNAEIVTTIARVHGVYCFIRRKR